MINFKATNIQGRETIENAFSVNDPITSELFTHSKWHADMITNKVVTAAEDSVFDYLTDQIIERLEEAAKKGKNIVFSLAQAGSDEFFVTRDEETQKGKAKTFIPYTINISESGNVVNVSIKQYPKDFV